jgi:hypothetical protein
MYVYCQQYQISNHKQLLISETSQRYRTFDKLQDFISLKRNNTSTLVSRQQYHTNG